jgi:hypothetical protein
MPALTATIGFTCIVPAQLGFYINSNYQFQPRRIFVTLRVLESRGSKTPIRNFRVNSLLSYDRKSTNKKTGI